MDADHATSFDIERMNPGETDWSLVAEDRIGEEMEFTDISGVGITQFRVRGRNSRGVGDWSEPGIFGTE